MKQKRTTLFCTVMAQEKHLHRAQALPLKHLLYLDPNVVQHSGLIQL